MDPVKLIRPVLYWLKTLAAGLLIVFTLFMLIGIVMQRNKRMGPFEPLISEAKDLNLTFEQAAGESGKFLGKHVIWCVQNRSAGEVSYRGTSKRFTVVNYSRMPLETGSKHAGCADMLLQIEGVTRTPSGSGIPSVRFILAL